MKKGSSFSKTAIGRESENRVADFLEKKGHLILERNFRAAGAEIDLITRVGETTCFVEVKSRKSERFGGPEESVDRLKRKKIIQAALAYMAGRKLMDSAIRFDVASVVRGVSKVRITYYENAFEGE